MSNSNKPNILFLCLDELRSPQDETPEIKQWRKDYLKTQTYLEDTGFNFTNHYTASTACSPSRASLFTGQYPSLHGVSQTEGAAKTSTEDTMFWLQPNTVPTMGNYFEKAGYSTIYKGKWHITNDSDIHMPGNNSEGGALVSYNYDGSVNKVNSKYYEKANTLKKYGYGYGNDHEFSYIGPAPISSDPLKSGGSSTNEINGRDIIYAEQAVKILDNLDKKNDCKPFFLVASLVNPHDITLYGEITKTAPGYNFEIDPSVPSIPASSTANEDLSTKPAVQQYYKDLYQVAFQPTFDTEEHRRLYYSLNLQADRHLKKIVKKLKKCKFYDNTIIVLLSDHGEMLGSHGGMFQKWYNMYEQSLHVPLMIKLPESMIKIRNKNITKITSNIDILPTLLGLCGINELEILCELKKTFIDARRLVGEDLSPLMLCNTKVKNTPILFTTNDNVFSGENMLSFYGIPYVNIPQPTNIIAIVVNINDTIWKFGVYYDDVRFWSSPGVSNTIKISDVMSDNNNVETITTTTYTVPKNSEFEMYNLTLDPNERYNLCNILYKTPESTIMQGILNKILDEEVALKLKMPRRSKVRIFDRFPRLVA